MLSVMPKNVIMHPDPSIFSVTSGMSMKSDKVPGTCRAPTSVLQELLELLINQQPNWTSQNWTALFTSILDKV